MNKRDSFISHRYVIEPGDGTRYIFNIIIISKPNEMFAEISESGVCIAIEGGYKSCVISLPDSAFYDLKTSIGYIHSKAQHMDRYTLAAVMKAVKILRLAPNSIEAAAKAMLDVDELL